MSLPGWKTPEKCFSLEAHFILRVPDRISSPENINASSTKCVLALLFGVFLPFCLSHIWKNITLEAFFFHY